MTRKLSLLCLLSLSLIHCQRGEPTDAAEASDESSAAASDNVAEVSPLGVYSGTLDQAGTVTESHSVEVLDYANGQLQLGIYDFCNVDLVGDGPAYTSAEGASCLVDTGDGRKPHAATADVTFANGSVSATVTFEGGAVWTYEGTQQ